MLTDDARPREEEEKLLLFDLKDLIVFVGHDVDVIAAAKDEFGNLPKQVRRQRCHRVAQIMRDLADQFA